MDLKHICVCCVRVFVWTELRSIECYQQELLLLMSLFYHNDICFTLWDVIHSVSDRHYDSLARDKPSHLSVWVEVTALTRSSKALCVHFCQCSLWVHVHAVILTSFHFCWAIQPRSVGSVSYHVLDSHTIPFQIYCRGRKVLGNHVMVKHQLAVESRPAMDFS